MKIPGGQRRPIFSQLLNVFQSYYHYTVVTLKLAPREIDIGPAQAAQFGGAQPGEDRREDERAPLPFELADDGAHFLGRRDVDADLERLLAPRLATAPSRQRDQDSVRASAIKARFGAGSVSPLAARPSINAWNTRCMLLRQFYANTSHLLGAGTR
jgi:hypothetical protein